MSKYRLWDECKINVCANSFRHTVTIDHHSMFSYVKQPMTGNTRRMSADRSQAVDAHLLCIWNFVPSLDWIHRRSTYCKILFFCLHAFDVQDYRTEPMFQTAARLMKAYLAQHETT